MAIVAAIIAVAGAAVTAESQRRQAKAQEIEMEVQQEQETLAAQGEELDRRRQLNRILASNIVGQFASGITGEGTPESIALSNVKTAALSESQMQLSQRLREQQLKFQRENLRSASRMQQGATLLKGATQAYGTGAFGTIGKD